MSKSTARALAAAFAAALLAVSAVVHSAQAQAADTGADTAAAYDEDGKFFTEEGVPTYSIADDGTVDWATFSGFRRYHSECSVCHGPDGEGSSYAPALKKSAHTLGYDAFISVVAGGKQRVGSGENSVMPAFGLNNNVMCYVDDIYTYLLARGDDAVARGRPAKRVDKTDAVGQAEADCMS